MRIKRINVKNFLSYANADADLSGVKVAGIVGEYEENADKSNGAGKSTLLEAIPYCLYGFVRTRTEQEAIRDGADGDMLVTLDMDVNGQDVTIQRGRTQRNEPLFSLSVDGLEFSGGSVEMQAKIEEIVGVNCEDFLNTVFFRQKDSDNFFGATPAKRKEFLRNYMNLGWVESCLEEVKERKAQGDGEWQALSRSREAMEAELAQTNKAEIEAEIERLESALRMKTAEIKTAQARLDGVNADTGSLKKEEARAIGARGRAARISAEVAASVAKRLNAEKSMKALAAEAKDAEAQTAVTADATKELEERLAKASALAKSLPAAEITEAIISSEREFARITAEGKELAERLKAIEGKPVCPVCDSELAGGRGEQLASKWQEKLTGLREALRAEKEKAAALQARKKEAEDAARREREAERMLSESKDRFLRLKALAASSMKQAEAKAELLSEMDKQAKANAEELERLQAEVGAADGVAERIAENERASRHLRGQIEALQGEIDSAKEDETRLRMSLERREAVSKTLSDTVARMREVEERRKTLGALEQAFGKNGISAMIIKASLGSINEKANEIYRSICGGQGEIEFEGLVQDKKGNVKESLEIWIRDGAERRKYESFSGGEADIINLSGRLALSDLLKQRVGGKVDIVVLDEVFRFLDRYNHQRVIEVINYLKGGFSQIFCISHTEIKDCFPTVITVSKDADGVSSVKGIA